MSKKLRSWQRKRMTTYIAEQNLHELQMLAKATGISMGKLIDQALDDFFIGITKRESGTRATAPVDKEFLKDAVERSKE